MTLTAGERKKFSPLSYHLINIVDLSHANCVIYVLVYGLLFRPITGLDFLKIRRFIWHKPNDFTILYKPKRQMRMPGEAPPTSFLTSCACVI